MRVRLLFEPRDLWIGLYWKKYNEGWWKVLTLYICLIPMLPIRVEFHMGTSGNPQAWKE